MKKAYESPVIAVEFFQMTQSIATCTLKIGLYDKNCIMNDPDATNDMKNLAYQDYFSGLDSCAKYPEGTDSDDGVCYHTNVNIAWNS